VNKILTGYLDEISYFPDERLVCRISGRGKATARIVRLEKTDDFQVDSISTPGQTEIVAELEEQALDAGSGFSFELPQDVTRSAFTVSVPVCLTFIDDQPRVVIAFEGSDSSASLVVDHHGLSWQVKDAPATKDALPVTLNEWEDLSVSVDPVAGTITAQLAGRSITTQAVLSGSLTITLGRKLQSFGSGCYGRFEGPVVQGSVISGPHQARPLVAFDFSSDFSANSIETAGIVGSFINHPTRRVLGRHRPDILSGFQDGNTTPYKAVHVHALDMTDARWKPTFEFTVPADCASGVYAVDIAGDDGGTLRLPFVIKSRQPTGQVLFILPTNTYIAYANERLAFSERGAAIASDTDGIHLNDLDEALGNEPLLGASVYDRHADGSGVHYSSRRRPVLNLTPDYQGWWCTQAPRHFLADLNIPRWLDHIGQQYDVVTDEDVHRCGSDLLKAYKVVMTGTHPEYPSPENLKAMHEFSATGNLLYLGGNGFYWVTGHDPQDLGVIETRRGYAGQRNWTSDPLELRLSTNNEQGGLWRHRGLAPNRLTGVGSVAVGFTKGSGYERTPESFEAKFASFFEGVDSTIGDEGEILGGAASDELDASNVELGTPANAVVLARSRHNRTYLPFIEEEVEIQHNLGGDLNPTVKSEIVYFERPTGGKVFSAGAINFCGALGVKNFDNSASRLLRNVLTNFLS